MSGLKSYLQRSIRSAQDTMSKAIAMDPSPARAPLPIFTFHTPEDIKQFATGCDSDIGGLSTCRLDIGPEGTGRFWGEMSLGVQPGLEGRMKSGYAAFRSKVRSSLFGEMYFDVCTHRYLHLRVRAAGDVRTRDAYFVNIQTETPVTSDIWQHRLFLRANGEWEDVLIPFRSFVLTNYGQPVQERIHMNSEKIRTFGISILGGKFGIAGKYELGIESMAAVHDPPRAAKHVSLPRRHALAGPEAPQSQPIVPSPAATVETAATAESALPTPPPTPPPPADALQASASQSTSTSPAAEEPAPDSPSPFPTDSPQEPVSAAAEIALPNPPTPAPTPTPPPAELADSPQSPAQAAPAPPTAPTTPPPTPPAARRLPPAPPKMGRSPRAAPAAAKSGVEEP